MLRDPWYTDNNFRSVHGAHTASILSFWSSMTIALVNSVAGLHASYNIHMRKCAQHRMCVVLEAMADAVC